MLRPHFFSTVAALCISASYAAPTFAAEKWVGKATNLQGNFNYGRVTFTRSGNRIKDLLIEGVTTSGCGGYKSVYLDKATIKGSTFSGVYYPLGKAYNDVIKVVGTIRGKAASGTFSEGPHDPNRMSLCVNQGKFTAKRK